MHWIEPEAPVRKTPAPEFSLLTPDGQAMTGAQFRQKKHLVSVFLPNPDQVEARALLDRLHTERDEFKLANAAVCAISPCEAAESTPLPVLLDADSITRDRYAALLPVGKRPATNDAFVMILNRYGVLEFAGLNLFEDGTTVEQITTYVWSLEYQCSL